MVRVLLTQGWLRVAPALLLSGCLVSFNDYPLGATEGVGGNTSAGSGGTAGSATTGGASAGKGGSNGNAGTPASGGEAPFNGSATLIDDFEDADDNLPEVAGRSGGWYAANDGQGMQTPAHNTSLMPSLLTPPRGDSTRAVHTFGGPFGQWGALIGVSLASDQDYDVSDYTGVRFWVRSGALNPTAADQVRFSLPTSQTNVGGGCTICNDHFGLVVPLTPQWARIEVRFSELEQEGFGLPGLPGPDLTRVVAIQFYFPQGVSFDLWLDDIELF